MIDARGPRIGAVITSMVLALILVLGPSAGAGLLLWQALVFAAGAILGLKYQPYGWFFRAVIRPRLGPPTAMEDPRPPRFAQAVGLVFALAGLLGVAAGSPALFYLAVGLAFAAAFLNAALDYCLGCEVYLLVARLRTPLRDSAH